MNELLEMNAKLKPLPGWPGSGVSKPTSVTSKTPVAAPAVVTAKAEPLIDPFTGQLVDPSDVDQLAEAYLRLKEITDVL